MTSRTYDAIVVGLGGMGSATAYHLARRGQRVLGLEAHERLHKLGSSHGRSRIIREAYFEAPQYVPLVRRSYELWRELEAESGRRLLRITGGINIGPPGGALVTGALASVREHSIPHEYLDASEIVSRFPALDPPEDFAAVYEPTAGALDPEACVSAHLDLAASLGAELRFDEPVAEWCADGSGVRVRTALSEYRAISLVLAPGPWAGRLLADLRLPLRVVRKVVAHFEPEHPELLAPPACPVFLWEVPEGVYYGLPHLEGQGVKFGRHDGGEECFPEAVRREVEDAEVEELRRVLRRYVPGAAGRELERLTCLYTMTPDEHFVVDHHPEHEQVVFCCGFSGHGFKFSCVVGEALADLITSGRTGHPIGFLSVARLLRRSGR